MLNLPFIVEHGSNRKALSDWFDEQIGPDIAPLGDLYYDWIESSTINADKLVEQYLKETSQLK
ncbi:hypothetical protein BC351_39420 [Paenibacillus ferrarius]|uniref:Uncharacterized protein n=1 Tax=Paenibacillus ferrarius TaxID=1469647 RepID=A0A1V4H9C8_9BACL|nr:hypothetical protein [Paenibacillus ferrarius]OPH47889.1 hypothetical protein BC351_39420 [Paenibacillus ferrarius]